MSTAVSPQSGATRLLVRTAEIVEARGFSALIVLPERPEGVLPAGARFVRQPLLRPRCVRDLEYQAIYLTRFVPSVLSLCRLIRSQRVDILHVNEILDVQGAVAASLCRVPLVWSVRASLPSSVASALSRMSVLLADKIIVPSASVQREVYTWYANANDKIEILHDPPRFTTLPSGKARSEWRQRLGITRDAPVVGLVSKLQNGKGHRWLIEAVSALARQYPDLQVAIAGAPVEGHEQDAECLYNLVDQLGQKDHIIFTGQIDDVPGFIYACDVMVHCPDYPDPFPGVVLEAMIAERPVVGSRIGGIPEQIVDGVTGFLVEPADPGAIATAVGRLLADPALRKSMGWAGRKRVLSEFSVDAYGKRLAEIYSDLVASKGA